MALKRFSEFEKKINIWADYYLGVSSGEGEESQGEKVKSNKSGFQAGFDIFSNEKFILGVYGGQSEISVKQNKDSADFTSVEAGAYGSVFAEMFSLFFNLGGNLYSVDAVRNLASTGDKNKSSFAANLIKGGIEAEFGHNGGQQAALKPFAAIEGSYLMSETIKEKGSDSALIIDESSFMRIDGKGGFKIGIQSGSFQLYTKAYLGYIFTGAGFDADISFAAEPKAGKMSISKTPEDNFFLGGSFGGKWMPFDSFKFFADISLDSMGGNVNYLMQAGIEMSFGVKKTEAEKEAIREAARLKKEQKAQEKQAKDEEKKRLQDAAQAEDSKAQEIERLQALLAEAEEKARQAEIASEPPFRTENIQETNSLADAVEDAKLRRKNPNVKSFRLSAASFKSASAVLTDQAKRDIAVLAQGMQNYNYNSIIVEGHADSSGGEIRNMELSQLRARAVFDELSKLGVRNINYIGLGSAFPIASNKTPAGRQQNRIVEVFLE
jgi:outer membrane protein OmpA-like peptidoglycan-associated protein